MDIKDRRGFCFIYGGKERGVSDKDGHTATL